MFAFLCFVFSNVLHAKKVCYIIFCITALELNTTRFEQNHVHLCFVVSVIICRKGMKPTFTIN
jgi:hypothetical protein